MLLRAIAWQSRQKELNAVYYLGGAIAFNTSKVTKKLFTERLT